MFSLTVNSLLSEFYYVGQLMVDQNDTRRRFPSRYTGCAKTVKNRSYLFHTVAARVITRYTCISSERLPISGNYAVLRVYASC